MLQIFTGSFELPDLADVSMENYFILKHDYFVEEVICMLTLQSKAFFAGHLEKW
jgi:hypothetical protein